MKKHFRIFICLFGLALCVAPARAQTVVIQANSANTTLTCGQTPVLVNTGATQIVITLPSAVTCLTPVTITKGTSLPGTTGNVLVQPPSGQTINGTSAGLVLNNQYDYAQILPNGTNWQITGSGVNGTGAPPTGSGQCTGGQTYTNTSNGNLYSCNGTTWVLAGPTPIPSTASAGGVGGASSVVLSPNCAVVTVNNCFFTNADTQVVYDASVTNTGTTVTCNSNCNFVAATDNNKKCWGVQSSGVYTFGNSLGTLTVLTAQTATCATGTGAVGTETSTLKFAWGHDDTPAITAATVALYALPHCGSLQFPGARMMLAAGVGMVPVAPSTCNIVVSGYYQGAISGFDIGGQSRQVSIIELAPGFDFTKCSANGCFWYAGGGGVSFHDFTLDGLNASLSGISTAPATTNLWVMGGPTGGRIRDVYLQAWAYSASNTPGGPSFAGQSIPTTNVETYNFGKNQGVNTCGQNTALVAHYAGGGLVIPANNPCIDFDGAYCTNFPGIDCISSATGSTFYAYGTYTQECAANSDSIAVTGTVFLNEVLFPSGCTPLSSNQAIKMTGGNAYLRNGRFDGGSTAGVISGSTGTVYNEGGNSTPGTGPFTFSGTYVDLSGVFPTAGCTGVAASSQATIAIKISGATVAGAAIPSTCTGTTADAGKMMPIAGTVYELLVTASATGSTAGSGLVTLFKNAASQTMTCTVGNSLTACTDGAIAHRFAVAKGDLISATFATGAAETLANVQVSLIIW